MRYRVSSIIFMICCVLLLSTIAGGDEFGRSGSLEILIRSNKPVYDFGEPIILTLKLKNSTNVPLIVNRRLDPFSDLQWELFFDPVGFVPIKAVPRKAPNAEDYIQLKPEQFIEKKLPNLSEIVASPLKQGLYGVRLTYVNKEKPKGPDTWTGEIITNRLSFQIKPSEKI